MQAKLCDQGRSLQVSLAGKRRMVHPVLAIVLLSIGFSFSTTYIAEAD